MIRMDQFKNDRKEQSLKQRWTKLSFWRSGSASDRKSKATLSEAEGNPYPPRNPRGPCSAFTLTSPAKLNNMPTIPLRWPSGWELFKLARSFPLGRNFLPKLAAGLRLTLKNLRHRSWPPDIAEQQHLDFKIAAVIANPQHVTNPNLARRLG